MERDSFVFYRSFYEAIKELPNDVQLEILTSLMEYSFNGNNISEKHSPFARSIFTLIKPLIDSSSKRYKNGCKGSEYGNKGGAPKGNQNATKKQPQNNLTVENETTKNNLTEKIKQPQNNLTVENEQLENNLKTTENNLCAGDPYKIREENNLKTTKQPLMIM